MDSKNTNGANDPKIMDSASGIHDFLQQIVDILQTSTIAEERGNDLRSKFWAAYKKVSVESDDNMLERCNGNMDIVLIFAGLFSAANTAFIIAMQPNPLDTTNALLVQLIQITLQGPSAAQPSIISPSTSYPSNFWIQAVSYMSLALSLLAAFGAVLGKQWLNHYKTHRYGNGSLEQRCMQRQGKLQGLERWCFEGVLQSFANLLKASLFLFALSLIPWMWTQQQTISIIIISATACGFVCYLAAIVASLVDPNCPFQTRLSSAIHTNPKNKVSIADAMEWMLKTSTNPDAVRAALEFMPSMSETLKKVDLAALRREVRAMFKACFDTNGKPILEDGALAYGKALIQFSWNDTDARRMLCENTESWNFWQLWRPLYLPRELKQCQSVYHRMLESGESGDTASQLRYKADIRTALDRMVRFTIPDDEKSIWSGKFGLDLDLIDVEWLMSCTEEFCTTKDFEAAGNALFLLSGVLKNSSYLSQTNITRYLNITNDQNDQSLARWHHIALHTAYQALDNEHGLPCQEPFLQAVLKAVHPPIYYTDTLENEHDKDHVQFSDIIKLLRFTTWPMDSHLASFPLHEIQLLVLRILPAPKIDIPEKYTDYCRAIIFHMNQPLQRLTALRIACAIRQDLATIFADGIDTSLRDVVISEFFPTLLTTAFPDRFDADGGFYYLRLVFCLASRSNWLRRLNEDGHIQKCISIIPDFCDQPSPFLFYLAGFFLRIQVAHREQAAPELGAIKSNQWWDLTRMAWCIASRPYDQSHNDYDVLDDGIEILGALVASTRMHMPQDTPRSELRFLRTWLSSTLKRLESREVQPDESILFEVKGLKDLIRYVLEAENVVVTSS